MEILAHRMAVVECLSQLPGKKEGSDLPLRLSSILSQLVMSGGKETNMKPFFKERAFPSYEFILSSGFSTKRGQKCSLLHTSQKKIPGQGSSYLQANQKKRHNDQNFFFFSVASQSPVDIQ